MGNLLQTNDETDNIDINDIDAVKDTHAVKDTKLKQITSKKTQNLIQYIENNNKDKILLLYNSDDLSIKDEYVEQFLDIIKYITTPSSYFVQGYIYDKCYHDIENAILFMLKSNYKEGLIYIEKLIYRRPVAGDALSDLDEKSLRIKLKELNDESDRLESLYNERWNRFVI